MNKTRDHLTRTEHTTAEGISHKNLRGNEQATQAMSEKKPAQSHVQSCRIDECLFETTNSDLVGCSTIPTFNVQRSDQRFEPTDHGHAEVSGPST